MANKESTYTLKVNVEDGQLKELITSLNQVEQALDAAKEIKFEIQSDDLQKMSETLSEIADKMDNLHFDTGSLGNADSSGITAISTAVDSLSQKINALSSADPALAQKFSSSGVVSEINAIQSAASNLTLTLSKTTSNGTSNKGTTSSSFNMSDWADAYTKEAEQISKAAEEASQKMQEALSGGNYQKTSATQTNWLSQYDGLIDKGVSESLDKARNAATEYRNIIQALQNDMAKASSQGTKFDKNFLLGEGWDESTLDTLPTKLKSLESEFKSFQSSAKIELGDLGLANIGKEVDSLSQSLSQNAFGAQMGDLQKTLDQFSNIDTPEFSSFREQLEGFYRDLSDLRSAFDTSTGTLDTDKLFNMEGWDASKLADWSTQFKNFYNNVKNSVKEFKDMEGTVDLDKVIGNIGSDAKMNNYTKQIDDLRTSISKLGDSDVKSSLNQQANDVQDAYNKMVDSINKFQTTSKESPEYKINMDAATQSVQEFQSKLTSCRSSVQEFTSSGSSGMASFASSVSSGLNGAIDMLNKMFGYNAIFREMRQVAQDCVSTIREVDSAMNQLEIVTGATASEMDEFFEASISQAKELGQSVTDVLDSIQVYSRLGYNLEEASELAEYTSILSNVADVGTEEATQGLTSVIKGFDMSVDDAEHVADVLIDIGQSYAVSASEILEAFTRSSAAFGATGTTFEEASAIIAAGARCCLWNAVMQSIRTRLIARISQSLATTIIWETNYECAKAETIARMNIWGNPTYFYNGQFATKHPNVSHRPYGISRG